MELDLGDSRDSLLQEYIRNHSSDEPEILGRLNRETHLKTHMPQMLSGPMLGTFLSMVSRMIKPSRILEIGTFTGYSAICLAAGLQENGQLITIEINPEMEEIACQYFDEAGFGNHITMYIGNAIEVLPRLTGPFDLIFIDANKDHYIEYFDLCIEMMLPGSWILADNTLWYGRVIEPSAEKDRETAGIVNFNKYVNAHPGVENLILPIRDGLTLIRKLK
jgi:predicted O-methyltransferase YrrM